MKKQFWKVSGLLIIVVALAGCMPEGGFQKPGRTQGTTPESGDSVTVQAESVIQDLEAVAVETLTVAKGDYYDQLYIVGQLEAESEYNVMPFTSGLVQVINVAIGDEVSAGDVLYVLDNTDLLTNKENSLNASAVSKEQSYNSVVIAEKDLQSSEMNLENAQKNYDDNVILFEKGFISESAMKGYEDALANAEISYDRSSVSLSNSQKTYSQAIDSYDQSLRDFDNNLEDMIVRSPIDGVVTRIDVQVDVTNNMNAGITVTATENVIVSGSVIEKYINDVEKGQNVSVVIDSVDKAYSGVISSVASSSSNSYYPIEIQLDNTEGLLKPGMYAGLTIDTSLLKDIVTVPKTAILSSGSTKYVFLNIDGIASKTLIQTGKDFGEVIEVTEGLEAGDEVVVEGQVYLEESTPLAINNEAANL